MLGGIVKIMSKESLLIFCKVQVQPCETISNLLKVVAIKLPVLFWQLCPSAYII